MTSCQLLSLNEVLVELDQAPLKTDKQITGLTLDSRKLAGGELFLAVPGFSVDGRDYISNAVSAGAAAVLVEADGYNGKLTDGHSESVFFISGLKDKVAFVADRVFRQPAKKLDLIGVTGTNGKTSCCWFISQLLSKLETPCAVMGTIGQGIPPELEPCLNTTSDAVATQGFMAGLVAEGIPAMAMEVSSHGLDQGRVDTLSFQVGVFTNLSRDHLDYHQTMEAYAEAKAKLFADGRAQKAVINLDDAYSEIMLAACGSETEVFTFSTSDANADIFAEQIQLNQSGVNAVLKTPWGEGELKLNQMGRFSLENMLAVIGAVCSVGSDFHKVLQLIPGLLSVPGRMQRIGGQDKPLVIVDYAHTSDALASVLNSLAEHGSENVTCVFGCGGDRDRGKRPLMARAALDGAQKVLITSDNPRSEDPEQIITDAMTAVRESDQHKVTCITDRASAIQAAVAQANKGDIVLIAGKGHEDYQEIQGRRVHFDDVEQAEQALTVWRAPAVNGGAI
ncbi:UDP-N-acetylmuramoyl-L-alanyl-D-glutamate--2,6-diaminopimelate ligase [Endozoicomonas sp. OPT23]|uniref:UDP-N-acetylmuramoyl-L-alanyl-D-glutamate--2, 6-diaminopimelate ligase n=1 Tax=Endozoicomonas sp. OPT23 TaxID=2072845 RepID=UPI00129B0738|nr:UDP-N-acetylmuramoyl-L-alanyl-D-glutamate--2,6-diaminopimelate ligase [Endozoicomonas sp. OPT23]MRI35383.1 UDP-N-acetylmuramoyl-L-alanyl-D-glutamate--2,6-diaminopimelate ligase [Endozoicomonas sp. OPT23]